MVRGGIGESTTTKASPFLPPNNAGGMLVLEQRGLYTVGVGAVIAIV